MQSVMPSTHEGFATNELARFRLILLRTFISLSMVLYFVCLCFFSYLQELHSMYWMLYWFYLFVFFVILFKSSQQTVSNYALFVVLMLNASMFTMALHAGPQHAFRTLQSSSLKILPLTATLFVNEYWACVVTVLNVMEICYTFHYSPSDSFGTNSSSEQAIILAMGEIIRTVLVCIMSCSLTCFFKRMVSTFSEALETRRRFIANMNHEIRTPLVGVIGITDMLLSCPDVPSALRENLEIAHSSGCGLLTVINNLLDLSKMDARKLRLVCKPFDLHQLVYSVVNMFMGTASKDVTIRCEIANDVPVIMIGDEFRLQQTLANLIGNACKFTDKGEIVLRVRCQEDYDTDYPDTDLLALFEKTERYLKRKFFWTNKCEKCIRFDVADTGVGIDRRFYRSIFLPFEQVPQRGPVKGSGLGLALCKEYVVLMRGKIWVQSIMGRGSTFSFVIPLKCCTDEQSPPASSTTTSTKTTTTTPAAADSNSHLTLIDESIRRLPTDSSVQSAPTEANLPLEGDGVTTAKSPVEEQDKPLTSPGSNPEPVPPTTLTSSASLLASSSSTSSSSSSRCTDSGLSSSSQISEPSSLVISSKSTVTQRVDEDQALRALIVDDNKLNAMVLQAQLQRLGFQCHIAHDGLEATTHIKSCLESAKLSPSSAWTGPDVIFMDSNMPIMSGCDATRCIRGLEQQQHQELSRMRTRIIALSATDAHTSSENFFRAGADDYLTKPVTLYQLKGAVQELIEKKRSCSDDQTQKRD